MKVGGKEMVAVWWSDDAVHFIDQRRLPHVVEVGVARSVEEVARAIEDMGVRGAPAIGVLAAYGLALAARHGEPVAEAYRRQLRYLGLPETSHQADRCIGSSDVSHVSRVVPTIHPNFPIGSDLQLHTREFAAAAASPEGERGLAEAARALALTVLELTLDPELRAEIAAAR